MLRCDASRWLSAEKSNRRREATGPRLALRITLLMEIRQLRVSIFGRQEDRLRGGDYIHDPHLGAALAHENPSVGCNGISCRDRIAARRSTPTPALAAVFVRGSGESAGSVGVYLVGFHAHVKADRLFTSTHVISVQRGGREAAPRLRLDHAKHHRVVGPNHKGLVRTD